MIQAVSSTIAKTQRQLEITNGSARKQWRTEYLGTRVKTIENVPQAYLAEMDANTSVRPHFHHVDEFQVLVAGSGNLGRNPVSMIALHYVDHHTAYGPINAGPGGLSFYTVRAKSDPGAVHLHKPGYKDLLKPTKKRYLLVENIGLSTEPVLLNRSEIALENLFDSIDSSDDGLAAFMLRLGPKMRTQGRDPKATGGQFYLVLNGSLELEGTDYPKWSVVYANNHDAAFEPCAGAGGVETLVLEFPRSEKDERT